jgi:hypothetical protein
VKLSAQGVTAPSYYSPDASGDVEVKHSALLRVDRTAPRTRSDARTRYVGSAVIHLSSTDALSGVAETGWLLDGVPGFGGSVRASVLGRHVLKFYSWDVAGNGEETHSVTFVVKPAHH